MISQIPNRTKSLMRYLQYLLLVLSTALLWGCDSKNENPSFTDSNQPNHINDTKFKLGVDRDDVYGPLLQGKRVGLMVNQSSIDSNGLHTIDKLLALQEKYGFEVTTLFAVEHGLRGNEEAGFGDPDYVEPDTGLQVWSLYGSDANKLPRKRPTPEKLENVDIVIFDLQDVGVRFFTYTISMHWMMESLQANNKGFMVFDRPNPNGDSIYGPLLEAENVSGVGIHPIPMAHGLTSGELADMIVGEGWLKGVNNNDNQWELFGDPLYRFPKEKLHIIPMSGYSHSNYYELPRRPSPNLATANAVRLYPSLALFEATSVNMGRGSDYPHEQTGFPDEQFFIDVEYDINADQQKLGWPHAGKHVYGKSYLQEVTGVKPNELRASIRPFVEWWIRMSDAGMTTSVEYSEESKYLANSEKAFVIRPLWLAKLVGNRQFLSLMQEAQNIGLNVDETISFIEKEWQKELGPYKLMRNKYQLYPD